MHEIIEFSLVIPEGVVLRKTKATVWYKKPKD